MFQCIRLSVDHICGILGEFLGHGFCALAKHQPVNVATDFLRSSECTQSTFEEFAVEVFRDDEMGSHISYS